MPSTNHKYDILVFIGRFQPFHRGHLGVVDHALAVADRLVILVGSANCARSLRNPWTYEERRDLIEAHFPYDSPLSIYPLNDITYNETAWIEQAQGIVRRVVDSFPGNSPGNTLHGTNDMKIGLIGAAKDHTSYYLKLFPTWDSEDVSFLKQVHATDIRRDFFNGSGLVTDAVGTGWGSKDFDHQTLQIPTVHFLREFSHSPEYSALRAEAEFVADYKKQWAASPYPPIFSTVDAVVVQSGHVLLVRRKGFPGQGQLALPGGFVGQTETLLEAAMRELREETRLKVPPAVLLGSMKRRDVFDDPNRSSRGRTITNAFLFHLPDALELPKVKGGDDAASAAWHPLGSLNPRECYEDHFHVLRAMTAGI